MPTLDWLDRERAMRRAEEVPYRLLESVSSHGDPSAGNLLVQGDNLEALKALMPFYRGRVKCIYIDPPYNTKSAFEHYDDNLLCYRAQGELYLVEREAVFDEVELDLLAEKVSLPGFQVIEQARAFELYLDGAKVKVGHGDAAQLELGSLSADLTPDDLVRWLDREVRQPDIPQAHLRAFLTAIVAHLANEQHIPLASLARVRHVLAQRVSARIEDLRTAAAGKQFKQLVLDRGWDLSVESARSFEFRAGAYAVSATDRYRGKWRFDKHFYPVLAKLRDGTEEFKCAVAIDNHPTVKHWVRNLERDVEGAFWLPTSSGKFFPDFVCELQDGRILVVEYKGEFLRNVPLEIEKDHVGRLWAEKSGGKCLFLMAFPKDAKGRDVRGQVDALIG